MSGRIRRDPVGQGRDIQEKLEALERRVAVGTPLPPPFVLPDRLGAAQGGYTLSVDSMIDSGWYATIPSTPGVHPPYQVTADPAYWVIEVINGGSRSVQIARPWARTSPVWQRWRNLPGDGSWTAWDRLDRAAMSGAKALRQLTRANYGDTWYETDTKLTMIGNLSNGWRQKYGQVTFASRAWDVSSTSALLAGRTDSVTLPTVLESHETLNVWMTSAGGGYDFCSISSITRNSSNTVLAVRLMQILAVATQTLSVGWEVVPAAV